MTIYPWQVLGGNLAGYGEPTRLEQNLLNFVAGEPASQNYLAVRGTYPRTAVAVLDLPDN